MSRRIVVIGGVAAGSSAASKAKRIDPDAEVTIIQEESVVSYGACGIPYVVEGIIDSFEDLIERPPEVFKDKYDIDVVVNTHADKIDPKHKTVYATNVKSKEKLTLEYDSLVIATGARAAVPNIKGVDKRGVFLVRNYGHGVTIREFTKDASSCIIVGGGLVGVEMAEAYRKRGMNVVMIERNDHILSNIIDKDLASIVEKDLEENGVKLKIGEEVKEIIGDGEVKGIRTDRSEIEGDFVLLGTGVRPNSEIARDAGVDLGTAGAIKVDDHMKTNIESVFAAGDCATARNYVTGKDDYLPLGTTANKQGRVAGENAAGGNAVFGGIAGSAITKTFDLYIGKTGLNVEQARKEGFDPAVEMIESITRSGYYPDNKPIWIKLVADKKSGKVLGSQIVGGEAVKGRIDLIAFALLLKASIKDIANYDACYVPPASPVWEPLNIAASQVNKLVG